MPISRTDSFVSLLRSCAACVLLPIGCLTTSGLQATTAPVCPSDNEVAVYPPLGKVGDPPAVASWVDLPSLPEECHIHLLAPAALSIALAGRFKHTGTADDLASRLGAVSATKGLPYWSVTDKDWRELVSDAFALDSPESRIASADFTAQQMRSGQTLYFAQNDSRSWGSNVYSIRAISSSSDHLVFVSNNVSSIRLGPLTLFEPDEARSVLFLDRLDESTWSYFSLAVITQSSLAAREKSLINRQAAFHRLLIGQSPDRDPPLAP